MTQAWNHLWNLLCVLCAVAAALPPDVAKFLPSHYQPVVVGVIGVLMWIKANRNLFINPDGTPASVGYEKKP